MKRVFTTAVEIRSIGDKKYFVGRAVPYNEWSKPIMGMFKERFLPGAFKRHLKDKPDIIAAIDHNPEKLLGRTASGTLRLTDSDEGIEVQVERSETSYAKDLTIAIERGDIRGMSFIFNTVSDAWHRHEGMDARDVGEAKLYEVSFVSMPAYPQTEAGLRADGDDASATTSHAAWRVAELRRQLHKAELQVLSGE